MASHKYREGVVYERSEVPQDFLPLRTVEAEDPSLRRHIASLCQRGEVRRYRCGKRMFVHKDDIQAVRVKWNDRRQPTLALDCVSKPTQKTATAQQYESAVIALCEINNGIALMQATLERLTSAVENIATQPKTAQQELLHTISSNGFHS